MRCDEARELIGAFIDGEASHPRTQALRDHTSSCAELRERARRFPANESSN